MKTYGSALHDAMRATGRTQQAFAKELGYASHGAICSQVNGRCLPSREMYRIICQIFPEVEGTLDVDSLASKPKWEKLQAAEEQNAKQLAIMDIGSTTVRVTKLFNKGDGAMWLDALKTAQQQGMSLEDIITIGENK